MTSTTKDAWNPDQYLKFKDERSRPFFDLQALVEPTPGARVVDLGCGDGALTAELHRRLRARDTTGIDNSERMLSQARPFAAENLRFEKQDIESWTPGEPVDVLFSNAALHWCEGHEALFGRLRAALAPHGQLAVQMPMNHDYATHVVAAELTREKPWASLLGPGAARAYPLLAPEAYAALMVRLGFERRSVDLKVYGHVLDSRDEVIEWVRGTLLTRYQSRLSEEEYKHFENEYRKRLFDRLPDEKPFFYPFKRILIWGRLPAR